MITMQHTGIYTMALFTKRINVTGMAGFYKELREELPFVLLPDAIRMYIGPRQAGHFEMRPERTGCSWMIYPDQDTLKNLTKETAGQLVKYHVEENVPKCVIGEYADIGAFDRRNWGHRHYCSLRIHMLQDYVLDKALREEMIDASNRFSDKFTARHNRAIVMDGNLLRQEIANFEKISFVHLAGKVYESTGILMNQNWFETNVLEALRVAYPADLADNTFRYMRMSDETNRRINMLEFAPTAEDQKSCNLTDDLETLLNGIMSSAYLYTLDMI